MKAHSQPILRARRLGLHIVFLLTALGLALACDRPAPPQAAPPRDPYEWAAQHRLVAHALGAVENCTYTNTRDAFMFNYSRGLRVFEVDLSLTREGRLVALHDWAPDLLKTLGIQVPPGEKPPLTYYQFKQSKIQGRFTTLGVRDLVTLLHSHPDAWLVTDTKITSGPEMTRPFENIIAAARAVDPAVLDRVTPQLYNQAMLPAIQALHPFRSWIYTLYQTPDRDDEVVRFVTKNKIRAVAMAPFRVNPAFLAKLKAAGVYTFIHTINDKAEAQKLEAAGAYGFYTDFLAPAELANPQQKTGASVK